PEWARWASSQPGDWHEEQPGTFATGTNTPKEQGWTQLRYRHLVPDPEQWAAIINGTSSRPPRPTLITDFSSYNTNQILDSPMSVHSIPEPHWVGDLTLSMQLQVEAPKGQVRLELVRGGVPYRCEI